MQQQLLSSLTYLWEVLRSTKINYLLAGKKATDKDKDKRFSHRVDYLLNRLKDGDSPTRVAAVSALARIREPKAIAPLIRLTRDRLRDVRIASVSALGIIGGTEAEEVIISSLNDKSWEVRQYTAQSLALIGSKRSVAPLLEALKDTSQKVRFDAADALGAIGGRDESSEEIILKSLRTDKRSVSEEIETVFSSMEEEKELMIWLSS